MLHFTTKSHDRPHADITHNKTKIRKIWLLFDVYPMTMFAPSSRPSTITVHHQSTCHFELYQLAPMDSSSRLRLFNLKVSFKICRGSSTCFCNTRLTMTFVVHRWPLHIVETPTEEEEYPSYRSSQGPFQADGLSHGGYS